ncbi:Dynein intermediate chain 2, axonemal [Habropoda laboriosa]|uniref:Dynein intermediate chain 2, axonemal n=1 Tax=Habropoda laboriosa TaxID=597456 RepID=A0A0L7QRA4_9HYME|nr:Dynein intermediate chain 2, axonemal [Habropoda laboriosa]
MEIQKVYVKTRAEFGKQCIFNTFGPNMDVNIQPNPSDMSDYIRRTHCHVGVQHSKQLALHELQSATATAKNSGMYHFEGGWPKEINPRDEETVARFRRRIEKDDNWEPKLHDLFEEMEDSVLQNAAVNIYEQYFDDMEPTELVQPLGLRTVNVYTDPETPKRPVTNISWSPDSGSRIAVCYCFLDFGRLPDYSKRMYIWQVDNPNEPYMALEPFCPCVACDFNPRDPSVLASGLMTGQVCNWDLRTGRIPVQSSHLQFSHRTYANAVKWQPSKSNTEFFSTSSDGTAMWWDTRNLREPTEVLLCDLEKPNDPHMDRAIGVSCLSFGPIIGTKFMFGLENGIILTGSRKSKTNAEKLAVRYEGHFGRVNSVDRNTFNPAIFLTVGDWRARIWAEDTREGNLISTPFLREYPTSGCWNKARYSVFYVTTSTGRLLVWDIIQTLRRPIFALQLCDERLTYLTPCDEGVFLAIGNFIGEVYLVEPTDFFRSFDKRDRSVLSEYLERCSKLTKAVDVRLREIKLVQKLTAEEEEMVYTRGKQKGKEKGKDKDKGKGHEPKANKNREKAAPKEKKKVGREDAPELVEAERRYFEAVQKGLEKYAHETDPDIVPVYPQVAATKKQEKKKRKVEGSEKETPVKGSKDFTEEAREADLEKKSSTRVRKKAKSTSKVADSWKKSAKTESAVIDPCGEGLDESVEERKKPKKSKISFTLPVPCKGEVCKPKVCCWRPGKKGRRKVKLRKEKSRTDRSLITEASGICVTKPMPPRARRHQTKKRDIVCEMRQPPLVLREEAARAKEELRRAVCWRGKPRRKYSVRRSRESRKKRTLIRFTTDDEDEDEDDQKKRRQVVISDPCKPPKARSTVAEFAAILDISEPILEEKKIQGAGYLEEYKSMLRRVYPRISEFHQLIE